MPFVAKTNLFSFSILLDMKHVCECVKLEFKRVLKTITLWRGVQHQDWVMNYWSGSLVWMKCWKCPLPRSTLNVSCKRLSTLLAVPWFRSNMYYSKLFLKQNMLRKAVMSWSPHFNHPSKNILYIFWILSVFCSHDHPVLTGSKLFSLVKSHSIIIYEDSTLSCLSCSETQYCKWECEQDPQPLFTSSASPACFNQQYQQTSNERRSEGSGIHKRHESHLMPAGRNQQAQTER